MANYTPRHTVVNKNLHRCPKCGWFDRIMPNGLCVVCSKQQRDKQYRLRRVAA